MEGGGRMSGWRWWRRRKYFSRSLICGRRVSRPYPGDPDSLAISRYPVVSAAYRVALITILMAHQRARERRVMTVREAGCVWGGGGGREREGKMEMETYAQRQCEDGKHGALMSTETIRLIKDGGGGGGGGGRRSL